MKTNLRIGEVLMERNYITQEQMEQALAYQKEHREKRVGQILIELGFVTESQVLEALAARLGLEIVSIGQMQVDLTAVRMIPRELAEKQNLLAVGFADKSLEVVTNDPLNYFAFEEVRQLTGCQVVIRLSEMGPLQSAIRYYYAEVGAQQAAQTANEDFAERNVEMLQVDESESGDPEAPIVKLLNSLLDRAISTGASDVHIEPFEGSTRVRMRIDGTIVDYVTLQRSVHQPLIARIKIMANLDIAERRLPQDGHFRIRVDRASTSTSVYRCCRPCSEKKPCCEFWQRRVRSITPATSAWMTKAMQGSCLCSTHRTALFISPVLPVRVSPPHCTWCSSTCRTGR